MTRRIETTALSRRLVVIAMPVTMMAVILWIFVLVWLSPTASHPVFYFAPAIIVIAASFTIWLELRLPRYVRLDEGVMTFESFFGTRAIPDGDILSLRNSFWGSWPKGVGPRRLVLTFKGGRRSMYGDFPELTDFLEEVRRRNPMAEVEVE